VENSVIYKLILATLVLSGCVSSENTYYDKANGVSYSEVPGNKISRLDGDCSVALYKALRNYYSYSSATNGKKESKVSLKYSFCHPVRETPERLVVGFSFSEQFEGNALVAGGTVYTYFDEKLEIVEWGT